MSTVTLLLTKRNQRDNKISIKRDSDYHGMFEVRYQPHEVDVNAHKFYLSESEVYYYIVDVLRSLDVDNDPFESLQVMTPTHPSIMYTVADIGDCCVRTNILDIIRMSLRTRVHRVCPK